MHDTHTIQENLSHLKSRLDSNRIQVDWRDRKAFGILIDYIEELESGVDYKIYLRRLTTYILVQYLELTLEGGLTKIEMQKALNKVESVYRVRHQDWEMAFASRCWAENTGSNYNDYIKLINSLVSDVIRHNTKQDDISAI